MMHDRAIPFGRRLREMLSSVVAAIAESIIAAAPVVIDVADLLTRRFCKFVCRQFGQPEESWRLVRRALLIAPVMGAGLLAGYCLLAWLLPGAGA